MLHSTGIYEHRRRKLYLGGSKRKNAIGDMSHSANDGFILLKQSSLHLKIDSVEFYRSDIIISSQNVKLRYLNSAWTLLRDVA